MMISSFFKLYICDNVNFLYMKILMLLDNQFPPDIRVEKEANSLVKNGNEVAILSYMFTSLQREELIDGIRIFRFRIPKQVAKKILGLSLQLPFYRWVWQRAIAKIARRYPFNVVHIHDLPLCILIKSIKRKYGVPVVADMHENYPYLVAEQPYMNSSFARIFISKTKWFLKEKEWLKKADAIICVAEEMKQRLEYECIDPAWISVVPNTPSTFELTSSTTSFPDHSSRFSGTFNILYVGGIDAVRGIDILIQATTYILKIIPELKVIIVGDGIMLSKMKYLASSLHLDKTISFEGWKPQNEIGSYILASDVCVIPHRKSPQTDNSSPNKLFQYLYFKKPVVSSNCNSLEKLILAEKCGMIYRDNSPEELAARLNYLHEYPVARIEMGNNGYEAIMNKYNWERTVGPLLSIYSSLNL
jgi:glycosyltransferase involved in cell wall biosynthesis